MTSHTADAASRSFAPVERIEGRSHAGVLLLCDHASNALPPEYGGLGLSAANLERHIAYDIGAADVVRRMAKMLNAPALLTRFSRLLIDANRGEDDPTLVMRLSDGALIPGNALVDEMEIEKRRVLYWRPYRLAIEDALRRMGDAGPPPILLSIHSFTPSWRGNARPWRAGVLWDGDPRIASPLLHELRKVFAIQSIGDNKPYDGALMGDTLNVFGTKRGLPHALIEIRQDAIAGAEGQEEWAWRLTEILRPLIADAALRRVVFHPSRAG